MRRVERLRQLGVAVHQRGPQVPLHAGGDAPRVQLRGVDLQALPGWGVQGAGQCGGGGPVAGGRGQGRTASRFLVAEVPDSMQKMTGK